MTARPRTLVLAVIDALRPAALRRAVDEHRAPFLAEVMRRGTYVADCVAAYPSVTPVCAASIATGVGPDVHRVPAMNWWHRGERRYVDPPCDRHPRHALHAWRLELAGGVVFEAPLPEDIEAVLAALREHRKLSRGK